MSKSKRISLNIFLLKTPEDQKTKKIFDEYDYIQKTVTATGKAKLVSTRSFPLGVGGELGHIYIKTPIIKSIPEWVEFFVSDLPNGDELDNLKNQSTSALLIREISGRQFAIAFGHGRHLLDLNCIEYRFGIKVALNVIETGSISSIDRQTFDSSPRLTKTQTVKPSAISEYGVNTEQDLLKGVVGSVQSIYQATFGSVVAGIDSLKISVITSLDKIDDILKNALSRYESKDYLKSDDDRASAFAWVDNLQAVPDHKTKILLDQKLWENIESNNFETIFLAIPEMIEWEKISGFAYTEAQLKDPNSLVNSLDIVELKKSLRSDSDIKTLKNRPIFMALNTNEGTRKFSTYKCIYAEIKLLHEKFLYILTAGNWFKVEPSFEKQIDNYFKSVSLQKYALPFMEYDHDGEGSYNDEIAASPKNEYILLDRKMIQFGGRHSSIEVCDLYKTKPAGKISGELVHVKRGRESSTLSHLFAQGLVSSTLLASEKDFITQVNLQIHAQGGSPFPPKFPTGDYDVVFAIVDGAAGESLDIPFFSKVNFRNCAHSIRAFGFGVKFLHIPESATYLAKSKAKKAAKAAAKKSASGKPVLPTATVVP